MLWDLQTFGRAVGSIQTSIEKSGPQSSAIHHIQVRAESIMPKLALTLLQFLDSDAVSRQWQSGYYVMNLLFSIIECARTAAFAFPVGADQHSHFLIADLA